MFFPAFSLLLPKTNRRAETGTKLEVFEHKKKKKGEFLFGNI